MLVFDQDVTAVPVFAVPIAGGAAPRRRIAPTLDDVATLVAAPEGRELYAAVRRQGKRLIVAVSLDDGAERLLGEGETPALSADGRHVIATVEAGRMTRIVAWPRGGGEARTLGTVQARVTDLRVGPDGAIHLAGALDRDRIAWRLVPGGAVERDAPPPVTLVAPAPRGGWRLAVSEEGATLRTVRLLPPGPPVDDAAATRIEARAFAWEASGESFVTWDGARVLRRRVGGGEPEPLAAEKDVSGLAIAPDGKTLYVSTAVGHVRRHLIVNFAERPRPEGPSR
jgi:hypothetical protein